MFKNFKILQKTFLLGVVVFFTIGSSLAKLSEEKIEESCQKLDTIMKNGIEKLNIPGAILVVARHDKIVHKAVFGKDTIDSNNPENLTEQTLFPASSLSKNVASILVGALVDDGKIKLDDKVKKYLPDLILGNAELTKEITVRDLISHRSGFKHFTAESLFVADYSNEKILDSLKILQPKLGKFRREYGYQNIIFGIVGLVLEKATGENYESLVKKYIFDKMEMSESSAIPLKYETGFFAYAGYRLRQIGANIKAVGFFKAIKSYLYDIFSHKSKKITTNHSRYRETIYPLAKNDFFQRFPATSGISMSANDFAKWLEMLANKGTYRGKVIVSEKVFKELNSPMISMDNIKDDDVSFCKERFDRNGLSYCSGIFSTNYFDSGKNPHKVWFHMGGTYGVSQFLAYSPEDDVSIGIMCNLGGVSHTLFAEYMVLQFLDLCFDFSKIDWIQKDIDRKNNFAEKAKKYRENLNSNLMPMDNIDRYVGVYNSDLYGDIKISKENDHLTLNNGIRKVVLKHLNGNIFEFPSKDILLSFFDSDDYIVFYKDQYGNYDSMRISCFHENDAVFKRR